MVCLNDLRQEKEIRHFCVFNFTFNAILCISCHFISSGAWDLYKQRKTNKLTTEVNYCKRKEKRKKKRRKRESSLHLRKEHKADSLQEVNQAHTSLPFFALFLFVVFCFDYMVQSKNGPSIQIYCYSPSL